MGGDYLEGGSQAHAPEQLGPNQPGAQDVYNGFGISPSAPMDTSCLWFPSLDGSDQWAHCTPYATNPTTTAAKSLIAKRNACGGQRGGKKKEDLNQCFQPVTTKKYKGKRGR
jgi:hypothetical protein